MSLKHLNLEFVSDFDIWISSLFSATKIMKIIVKILSESLRLGKTSEIITPVTL